MAIWNVALRLQSSSLPGRVLASLAGDEPDRVLERGSPVSSRNPAGPTHSVTTVTFEKSGSWEQLGPVVRMLEPMITRVAAVSEGRTDFRADIVVGFDGRPFGSPIELDNELIGVLAAGRCGLVLDAYCPDSEE